MIAALSLENPATMETYTFLQRARDTDGALLRLEWRAEPGGRVGEHVHPIQEERFEVRRGALTVSLEGRQTTYRVGDAVAVPPGKRHFFANHGSEPVTATLELRPALRMEEVFEALAGMAREGKTRADGLPRNPVLLAVFADEYRNEIRGARPPDLVQRIVVPPLAALGRRLGFVPRPAEYAIEVAGRLA